MNKIKATFIAFVAILGLSAVTVPVLSPSAVLAASATDKIKEGVRRIGEFIKSLDK